MDWATYKALCDRPEYWSGWMLAQSAELCDAAQATCLASRLRAAAEGESLPSPTDFSGPDAALMFRLELDHDERRAVLSIVERAVVSGETTSGTRARGLGGFLEAWREYVRS